MHRVHRWLPLATAIAAAAGMLAAAGTAPADLGRYATLAVALPGTLVYRSLRRTPHSFVEDVASGVAVGLVLELAAWALYSAVDLRGWLWTWPILVVGVYAAVPALRRRCWRVNGYTPVPLAWAWAVAGVVVFFTGYLSLVFLRQNPILPESEHTRQYLDLAYQLSLAGETTHRLPPGLPQAAGEPLQYHWFSHAHMGITSMVAGIDLPVVALRLAIPALCAAAVVLTAAIGWRISGRPYAGVAAAVLFWVIGEVWFTDPLVFPFGTQATFVVWHGVSMIYSWVLLLALIGAMAAVLERRGSYLLCGLLLLASSGAKASTLPVVVAALGFAFVAAWVVQRRPLWSFAWLGALALGAQLFSATVLFGMKTYGLSVGPLANLRPFWDVPDLTSGARALVVVGVFVAFAVNMLLRLGGIPALVWLRRSASESSGASDAVGRRGRLTPVQWMLLGGALAGPALYLTFTSVNAQYFTRTGFAFGILLSGWGYAQVLERAQLDRRGVAGLGCLAGGLAVVLTAVQIWHAEPPPPFGDYRLLLPTLRWAGAIAITATLVSLYWWLANRGGKRSATPRPRRRAAVALTIVLMAGAPGLVMDMRQSLRAPNGGPHATVPLPLSRVEAARWVREHSAPDDVLLTNAHCLQGSGKNCDARSFWLSAYAERSVLVEGWGFAPRLAGVSAPPFWDPDLLRRNDAAIYAPTASALADLRDRYGVRWLVVDREVGRESADLARLATPRFDNGRIAVYELGAN